MNSTGPVIGPDDEFEGQYTEKFRALVHQYGLFIQYERDRAALDMGLHLTTVETPRRVSHTRIWFQLKGIHKSTLPADRFYGAKDIPVQVKLHHLKFWFASPEPIYLAVYVEAVDQFFVEDVRELVEAQWGESFLAPGAFRDDQQEVTLKIRTDTNLTHERIERMRRHQSMRIDGPFFRGRPLGHRLDPLRCSLNKLEPAIYVSLVKRLLEVHDYRVTEELSPATLFSDDASMGEHIVITQGKLYNTFEWVPHLLTEFGTSPADDFRIEGKPQFAQGSVVVCIHGNPQSRPHTELLRGLAHELLNKDIKEVLVFANTDDYAYFGSFFGGFRGTGIRCTPQLLGELAYSLLTITMVYLEFREAVSWKFKNFLLPREVK